MQSHLAELQDEVKNLVELKENNGLELFNIRNNIEDLNVKIVYIVHSHKRSFNIDIDQMLNNIESQRMEC